MCLWQTVVVSLGRLVIMRSFLVSERGTSEFEKKEKRGKLLAKITQSLVQSISKKETKGNKQLKEQQLMSSVVDVAHQSLASKGQKTEKSEKSPD